MGYGQYSLSERPQQPAVPDSKEKTKRLKHVWDDPSHVWAHPRQKDGSGFEQDNARNPQNNFYFKTVEDGTRTLYSYRDSYPIASRFEVKKKPVYLLRSGKPYSVTTARHFNMAESSVRNADRVFFVPYVTRYDVSHLTESGHHYGQEYPQEGKPDKATHAANVKNYVTRIVELIAEYGRVTSSWSIATKHSQAIATMREVKAYCKVFGLKLPKLPQLPKLDADRIAKAKSREEYRHAHAAEIEAKRDAERLEKQKEQIAEWKRGATHFRGNMFYTRNALLRVVRDPETGLHSVETSQGVSVPVSGHLGAARLLRFLEALKASGRTYEVNGHSEHIGQFTVQSFKPAVLTATPDDPSKPEWILTAGCHRITWEEVQTVAPAVLAAEQHELEAGIAWG